MIYYTRCVTIKVYKENVYVHEIESKNEKLDGCRLVQAERIGALRALLLVFHGLFPD